MSVSAHLVCHERRLSLGLGKPLRHPDGTVFRFALPTAHVSEADFARALDKFLRECGDHRVTVRFSGDPEFEMIASYPEVGGWPEDGDIPFDEYLRDEPRDEVHYYAKIRPGFSRENPSGMVRRRVGDGHRLDEAFTRNLRWEPTEYLRRYALGHDDVDHVEVSEAEATQFVLTELWRLGG